MSAVGEHLGHQPQTGQRQDAGERQRLREAEAERELEAEEVGSYGQRRQQRDDHRQHRGDEVAPADGGYEAREVDLVEADEKEQHEDAEPQEKLDLRRRLDDAEDRAEQHAGHRIGQDRAQAEAAQDTLDQLGHHDQQADGEQDFQQHQIAPQAITEVARGASAGARSVARPGTRRRPAEWRSAGATR